MNDDLPVCMELDNDSWEADFFKQLGQEKQKVADEKEDREDEMDSQPLSPKLPTFKEAVQSLENVQQFLESRGYIEALRIGSAIDTMTVLKLKSSKQTTNVVAEHCHSGLILSVTVIITNPNCNSS